MSETHMQEMAALLAERDRLRQILAGILEYGDSDNESYCTDCGRRVREMFCTYPECLRFVARAFLAKGNVRT